ncbi:MAG: FAD-dependent oxidoreductase [Candidatus Lokiarchaeota archaeon]|nr:FAD-dependent oxidoreductase [Candidatus Lokiarchaeota archaeon]
MTETVYDVIVIGSGPAGITAAIYAQRYALKTALIGNSWGGAISKTHVIENYPGFKTASGFDFMQKWRENIEYLGIEEIPDNVTKIEHLDDGRFRVLMDFGTPLIALTIIYALGMEERKMGVPGEEELLGRGVSYCATCDGPFFKGKRIGVIGGSDTAAKEALYLSQLAEKVYMIYRNQEIRPEPINKKRVEANPKIEIIPNTTITSINGTQKVESVTFHTGEKFPLDAVFVEIGADPRSKMAKELGVLINSKNEVIVDEQMHSNIPGFFAAGDVVNRREKQVIVASGHGAIAAFSAYDYVQAKKP